MVSDTRKAGRDGGPSFLSPRVLVAIGFLLCLAPASFGASLKVRVPDEPVAVGVAFRIGVSLDTSDPADRHAALTGVEFTDPPEAWHLAEAWHQPIGSPPQEQGWTWVATLQAFEVGELELPRLSAQVRHPDGTTEEIRHEGPVIRVIDGLDDDDAEYHDLRSIRTFRSDRRMIAMMIAGGLVAGALLLILGRRMHLSYLRRRDAPPAPLAPLPWALGELNRRQNLPACRGGNSKAIVSEVSDVIRRYLQRKYGFAALEMTTQECVGRLNQTYVPAGFPQEVQRFLEECDLVKFTRIDLSPARKESIWDDARILVKRSHREDDESVQEAPESNGPKDVRGSEGGNV